MSIFAAQKLTGLPLSRFGAEESPGNTGHSTSHKEAAGDGRAAQKRMTARKGKGEKAGQEPTRPAVTQVLCALEVASSCIPASEGCPPKPEGRTRVSPRARSHSR